MVAKTIGTIVSFAWETVSGVRPTAGYKKWCDCTSHPDFNPEPDSIETTTLCARHNHTYEDGLVDFGTLEFGANLTSDTYDLIMGTNGLATLYDTKQASGLGLWVCVDIQGFNQCYYVPIKPQRGGFGLPEGISGSNKYDLIVRFLPTGDGAWYNDAPVYDGDVTHTATVSGYATGATLKVLDANNNVIRNIVTEGTSTAIVLIAGEYLIIAEADGEDPEIKTADLTTTDATITFGA